MTSSWPPARRPRYDNDGEIFNIGNPSEITIRALAERIRDLVGLDLPIVSTDSRVGDPARRCPDISKIQARYGWQPDVDLDAGLRATLASFAQVGVAA